MSERKRVCFLLHVRKDLLQEYRERHSHVWPEMLQALRETGWHNYSLYLSRDGLLIGYLETPDFAQARAGMAAREVNVRWQQEMTAYFEDPDNRPADQRTTLLEEVFHLD